MLGARHLAAAVAALALTLLAGCGDSGRGDVGTAKNCPHRDAYCPVDGPGVSWPGRPSLSPSGRFRLEVLRVAQPANAGEDWGLQIVEVQTGAVALAPAKRFDGGLGLVFAWGENTPDTAWAGRPTDLGRWRSAPDGTGAWAHERPGPDEKLPAVVVATFASDTG